MNSWVKKFLPILTTTLLVVFLSKTPVFAHPGRTAADGCHYCRTNCGKWGVPWNARHCHGGVAPIPPPKIEPKPITTPKTVIPTSTPTPTPTPTPLPSPQPQETPEVKGATTQEAEPLSDAEAIGFLGVTGAIIGGLGWGAHKLFKKLRA